jgi:hypothetical protein
LKNFFKKAGAILLEGVSISSSSSSFKGYVVQQISGDTMTINESCSKGYNLTMNSTFPEVADLNLRRGSVQTLSTRYLSAPGIFPGKLTARLCKYFWEDSLNFKHNAWRD